MLEIEISRLVASLEKIVGPTYVFADAATLEAYSHDETENLTFAPHVVVKPGNSLEISMIMIEANQNLIPVTVRGGGTGLSGSALPVKGGILISMERFSKILEIDIKNHQVTAEPGVITEVLQQAVAAYGLFYPVDPASKGSCTLGGNLAQSSGGPRAVKYGTTRENVLNMEVVLPTGEIIWTGANVLKFSSGYNLTQLMIGSEGTLGIVTKAVLKLRTLPMHDVLMLVPFRKIEEACAAVSAIFMAGITPSCLEFMERNAIDLAVSYTGSTVKMDPDIEAHLLIELDGNDASQLTKEAEAVYEVLLGFDVGEVMFADSDLQKEELWMLRRKAPYAVKHTSIYKEEDTVVPRYHLPQLIRFIKQLEKKFGFTSVCYGHAGDGNLHVNILQTGLSEAQWNTLLPVAITELFREVVALGGTISGEHGIGLVQKPYLPLALSAAHFRLMSGIKRTFDPNNILNPGKIFDLV